jgi:hypothetical protein
VVVLGRARVRYSTQGNREQKNSDIEEYRYWIVAANLLGNYRQFF